MTVQNTKKILLNQKFVPIFVSDSLDAVLLAECCVAAGCKAVEITCRRKNVVSDINRVKTAFPDLKILVGSIIDDGPMLEKIQKQRPDFPSISELVNLGIDGLVSAMPLKISTISKYRNRVMIIPGVMTVAEAVDVLEAGAGFAKFFDLSFRGEEKYARMLCGGPFHGLLEIFVTGGVTLEKIQPYFAAGVKILGSGFDVILRDSYTQLQKHPVSDDITSAITIFLQTAHL